MVADESAKLAVTCAEMDIVVSGSNWVKVAEEQRVLSTMMSGIISSRRISSAHPRFRVLRATIYCVRSYCHGGSATTVDQMVLDPLIQLLARSIRADDLKRGLLVCRLFCLRDVAHGKAGLWHQDRFWRQAPPSRMSRVSPCSSRRVKCAVALVATRYTVLCTTVASRVAGVIVWEL